MRSIVGASRRPRSSSDPATTAATPSVVILAREGDAVSSDVAAVGPEEGCRVVESTRPAALVDIVRSQGADLVVISAGPGVDWNELEIVRQVRATQRTLPIILVTSRSSEALAIAALKEGVDDYFRYPAPPAALGASVRRLLRGAPGAPGLHGTPVGPGDPADAMVATSPSMRPVKTAIVNVAATDSNVLITGETGTGKELVAGLIHRTSRRQTAAFVAINCAAIPEALVESELFGHERGAFTGALARQEGKLEVANHGTVFFDEIGDMSLAAQAKILRVIESREVYRLGGRVGVPLDVRVIAATNQDLETLAREAKFRGNLYFRLNVARIHLPPLRERKEDIPFLLARYVSEFNRRFDRAVQGVTQEGLARLLEHDWPGNVRELRNVVETAFVNGASSTIAPDHLPGQLRRKPPGTPVDERQRLLVALLSTNWNKSRAAERLQWSRMTLYRKIAKYHLFRAGDARRGRSDQPPE